MQFSQQLISQCRKTSFIVSCSRLVTHCNLQLQLAMISKKVFQPLKKVELSSETGVTSCSFSCNFSCNVEKGNQLQVTADMWHVAISRRNFQSFKRSHCNHWKNRVQLYPMQSLEAQNDCDTGCWENMLHAAVCLQIGSQCCCGHKL